MKAYFFGAGSSSGTLADWPEPPPISAKFGAALIERIPQWKVEYPGLAEVATHLGGQLEDLSLEEIWTSIDYWAKLGPVLPWQPQWNPRATWDLKRLLLRFYGSSCGQVASTLERSDVYTLGALFANEIQPGDVLVSFNYDTIVERLANTFGRVLRSPCQKPIAESLTLAKPHGSASWRMDWQSRRVVWTEPDGSVATVAMEETDVGPDQEPLVLGAVPIKSELVREVQMAYFPDVWDVVTAQWRTAVRAVRDATALVFVGYGFPPEDQYGSFLFRQAMRMRSTGAPAIEFYELSDREECTKAAIRKALGNHELGPVPKGRVTSAPPPEGSTG